MEKKKGQGLQHVKVIRSGGFRVDMNKYLESRRSKASTGQSKSENRKGSSTEKGQS